MTVLLSMGTNVEGENEKSKSCPIRAGQGSCDEMGMARVMSWALTITQREDRIANKARIVLVGQAIISALLQSRLSFQKLSDSLCLCLSIVRCAYRFGGVYEGIAIISL